MTLSYIVTSKDINIRQILKEEFNMSTRFIAKLKQNNRIKINDVDVQINYFIKENEKLDIFIDFNEESKNIVPIKMDLEIIYEDESLLVINKPAGIPVHPSSSHFTDSLSNGVKYYYNLLGLKTKIRLVNRLDKDTSGIVILAKSEYVQESITRQMKIDCFEKRYIALVEGIMDKKRGIINAPIARKENSIIERCISNTGDFAITEYIVIKEFENYTLVYVTLKTGRTHQIRVHMKSIGHPILGDTLYGNPSNLIARQALHSCKVSFIHPINKKRLVIEANIPQDISSLII